MTGDGFGAGLGERRVGTTAAALSVLATGLGHFYLRRWVRGTAWIAATLGLFLAVAPSSFLDVAFTGGTSALPSEVVIDAGWLPLAAIAVLVQLFGTIEA